MDNAERFIEAFNRLDHYFEYLLDGTKVSFIEKKNILANDRRFKYVVRRYEDDLEVINRLRNVVAHENYLDGRPLADPREDIIDRLEEIFEAFSRPMTVYERRSDTKPVVFNCKDLLSKALKYMMQNDFSQVIVERSRKYCLLRREDTAKWLEKHAEAAVPSAGSVAIEDLMSADVRQRHYISKNATVYEALAYFQENDGGYPALIITEGGKDHEIPLGILTPMDLIDFVSISRPSEY